MKNLKKLMLCTLISFSFVACKSKKVESDEVVPANNLYEQALEKLQDKDYKKAAEGFEKIFFQHPGNEITPLAELMQAYSLYLSGDYDEAVDILDMFIKLHPRHQYVDYAYYMKGLSNYVQISEVKLDQSRARFAKEDFEELMARFPGSKYSIDAGLKIDLVNDHLAGKELLIGRYYLDRKNPIAALKRFQKVVQKYNTTSHITEALYRLVESNLMLGLKNEAAKYEEVLKYNYPDSKWSKYADDLMNR